MNFWSYSAPLRQVLSVLDFFAVYFTTLLGRCAAFSLPALGLVLLARRTVWRRDAFARGAAWAALVPVLFLGKLRVFYECRAFLPLLRWQSLCCGYRWVRHGYLLGAAVQAGGLLRRRARLRKRLRALPAETVAGQRVRLCGAAVTPFAAGLLPPEIVLPRAARDRFGERDLRLILLHERTHIRLGHLWFLLLWDALCALLWVNPLLRLSTRLLKEDLEQICDAVTIRRSGRDAVSYGRVMLRSMALLREEAARPSAAFAAAADFEAVKRRVRGVRDYRPYPRRRAAALCAGMTALTLAAALVIHQASLPRCTDLTGFQIFHVSGDVEFTALYESETGENFPVTLDGDRAEVDSAAFRALLPSDAPRDGCYYIMWGGFMKLPGIGGAMNSIYVDALSDAPAVTAEFQDVNDLFYVRLVKWV